MRRIVITGLGAVTALAAGVETSWSRLLAGRSGIRRLPDDVVSDLPAKVGGVVHSLEEDSDAGFDPDTVFAPKDQRRVDHSRCAIPQGSRTQKALLRQGLLRGGAPITNSLRSRAFEPLRRRKGARHVLHSSHSHYQAGG
jgi:3-oxoacyl-(acyl-carrier-protein) synthase